MEKTKGQKSLGVAVLTFYGIIVLAAIVLMVVNLLGLSTPVVNRVIFAVQDAACCCAVGYIALSKPVRAAATARIGATVLAVLFAAVAVNMVLSFAEINIFASIGNYAGVVISSIQLIAAAMLFLTVKAWIPVKVTAFLFWIPGLCASFYFSELKAASELAQKTDDWSVMHKILNAVDTCDYISLALAVLTVILAIVWIVRKPKAPHAQNNPIDII